MKIKMLIMMWLWPVLLLAQQNPASEITSSGELDAAPGISVFAELAGKGYFSGNIEFPLPKNQRISVGLTLLDYDLSETAEGEDNEKMYPTPGVMYYYLIGKKRSFFELGAGISVYPQLGKNKYDSDGPVSLHGVIGYRYQKKNGLLFRAGFTPFKRINNWFLPLFGISVGYSW